MNTKIYSCPKCGLRLPKEISKSVEDETNFLMMAMCPRCEIMLISVDNGDLRVMSKEDESILPPPVLDILNKIKQIRGIKKNEPINPKNIAKALHKTPVCPNCKRPIFGRTDTSGTNAKPKKYDVNICDNCFSLHEFIDDYTLREITEQRLNEMVKIDPMLAFRLAFLKKMLRERKELSKQRNNPHSNN